jgi:hypothetical protein
MLWQGHLTLSKCKYMIHLIHTTHQHAYAVLLKVITSAASAACSSN